MKIRNSFVSNSSSSSFIIIDASNGYVELAHTESPYDIIQYGVTEFGWGPETIYDIHSRVNFAAFQALLIDRKDWLDMLTEVIKENSNITDIIYPSKDKYGCIRDSNSPDDSSFYSYIDHSSSSEEGENIEMFDSKEMLKDFIFGKGSRIELDNDNHQ